jgi:hypothetical protein
MEDTTIESLIANNLVLTGADLINPDNDFVVVGMYQQGTNKYRGAGTSYKNYALPLSALLTSQPNDISFAASDEVTPLTVGTDKITIHAPYNFTLLSVFAGLSTVQNSGNLVKVDINKNGASIFSTLLTISNNQDTSLTAAVQPVFNTISFIKGDKITVDISDLGDGTATGLKIYLYVQPV